MVAQKNEISRLLDNPLQRLGWSALISAIGIAISLISVGGRTHVEWFLALLVGIAMMGVSNAVLGMVALWPASQIATRDHASDQRMSPAVQEFLLGVILITSVVAAVVGGSVSIADFPVLAPVIAATAVVGNWFALHINYAGRYAAESYSPKNPEDVNGMQFLGTDIPAYRDFIYFAFNIGMTYQVSDTVIKTPALRSLIFRHSVLSYFVALVLLGGSMSVLVGLFSS